MKLFGYLPETLFHPLAGPKKHLYGRLLLRLYERVFAARVLETPSRDEVLRHVGNFLVEMGVSSSDDLQEEGVERDIDPHAHYVAYHRLRNTGWLTEEHDKWDVRVDMHPDAFMLLGAIFDLTSNRVRVAGAVVEVKSNLESASKEPEQMAQGLANACETAVRFARSMRRVLVAMREIEERILGNPNAAAILHTFFGDFVDGLLIADYKQLKTSNNPYRYRRHISTLASELAYDVDFRTTLAQAYIDQGVVAGGTSLTRAEERVLSELEKIRQVFEDVGPFMERIDDFRDRLERRVRTTVHYMDVMGTEGSAERIAQVIEQLAAANGDAELRLRTPDTGFPISALALYTPPPPRTPPEKTRFRLPERDPYLRAYVAATTAFDTMVHVTPARTLAFLDGVMHGRDRVHSSDINVGCIGDLLAYRSIPSLVTEHEEVQLGEFRIVRELGRTPNEWIDTMAFKIERKPTKEV